MNELLLQIACICLMISNYLCIRELVKTKKQLGKMMLATQKSKATDK